MTDISVPKGGGALSGIGETFQPDLHTGTGNFTVPIPLPPGRGRLKPSLSLAYSSGSGNGAFGLGWALSMPRISRRTERGVPTYDDTTDVFVLSGAEELRPVPVGRSTPSDLPAGAQVKRYRPRTEAGFARIIHVVAAGVDYWDVWSRDGLRSRYGTARPAGAALDWSDPAVIRSPEGQIFSWLLTRTIDSLGNHIAYDYVGDGGAQRYLSRVAYADYGDSANPSYAVTVTATYDTSRPDPFSDRKPGFDLRTVLRTKQIEVRTAGSADTPTTVVALRYADQTPGGAVDSGVSLLTSIQIIGQDGVPAATQSLPPLTFTYRDWNPAARRYQPLSPTLPPGPLGNGVDLIDLFADGLPSIAQLNGSARYWRNRGDGTVDRPRPLLATPSGAALGAPGVLLSDVDGDGRPELSITAGARTTVWALAASATSTGQAGFSPTPLATGPQPSVAVTDPRVRLIDLDGNHVPDLMLAGNPPAVAMGDGRGGFTDLRPLTGAPPPLTDFTDPRVQFADMTGDGLTDLVLIHNGSVCYWPNLGHGRFGPRIVMTDPPRFPDAARYTGTGFDPRRLLLGSVTGLGPADLVYVDQGSVTVWVNQSGNGFAAPVTIRGTPRVDDRSRVRLADVNGVGVVGVLWSGIGSTGHWAFLDLTGGAKPYLMTGVDNHRGATTTLTWSTSTAYAAADRTAGRPWRTPLPFPVHVLAGTETRDQFAQTVSTSAYRYHDGYWDPVDREFRGFGCVEQIDTLTPVTAPPPAMPTVTPLDPLTQRWTVPAEFDANGQGNLLRNWSFENADPGGPSELTTPDPNDPNTPAKPWGGGRSAAAEWGVWNNTSAKTRTDLQTSTLPQGRGGTMLHVDTTGARCGIVQNPFFGGRAPRHVVASIWIKVMRGRVYIGTGNGGNTGADASADATGEWTLVQVGNGNTPANEFIVYAEGDGGAEFFVDHAWITDVDTTPADPVTAPPLRTVTWFHLGPIGRSATDWTVHDPSTEYWRGDPPLGPPVNTDLVPPAPPGRPPFALREAIRAIRGHILRTEVYSDDGDTAADRPYEVHDTALETVAVLDGRAPADPTWHDLPVIAVREVRSRTTAWERGTDPLTRIQASGDYDEYNRPRAAVALGVPRRRDPRDPHGEPCLATVTYTSYATRDDTVYRLDTVASTRRHQAIDPGTNSVLDFLSAALEGGADGELRGIECHYYDGEPFVGLALGELGDHALPVRAEHLAVTPDQLRRATAAILDGGSITTVPPYLTIDGTPATDQLWADYPPEFRAEVTGAPAARGPHLGYTWHDADAIVAAGYYIQSSRQCYDVQTPIPGQPPRGLLLTSRDPHGADTTTVWDDDYALLPVTVTDPNNLSTIGTWNTRLFKPASVTDPNGNTTAITYTPLGLPAQIARLGKQDGVAGDTLTEPGQEFTYDLTAYDTSIASGSAPRPISVTTIRRVDHRWTLINDENARRAATGQPPLNPDEITGMFGPEEATNHPERFIRTVEYSDGLGRLLQTRTQADDLIVTDVGLTGDPSSTAGTVTPDAPVTGETRVVVSGWKIYDNKGRPVRTYEPFFDSTWSYRQPSPDELATLAAVTQHYDPRGRPTTTIAPDGGHTRIVRGTPSDLHDPDVIDPNPWDTYTYGPDDNAGRTHPTTSLDRVDHWNTPTSTHIDALGHTVRSVQRSPNHSLVTTTTYDIDGHPISVTDPLNRLCAVNVYDCTGTAWASWMLDAGTVRTIHDATGAVTERRDDKDALTLSGFDTGHRPTRQWARDRTGLDLTLREITIYGDDTANNGLANPQAINANGRVVIAYDEAGRLTTCAYDIDGNPVRTTREIINPAVLVSQIPADAADGAYLVDWQPDPPGTLADHATTILDSTAYITDATYDALARHTSTTAPLDNTGARAVTQLVYGRGGGLTAVTVDKTPVLSYVAYDAHGRRSVAQFGNGVLHRYLYDPSTQRLRRTHVQTATRLEPLAWAPTGPVLQDVVYRQAVGGDLLVTGDRTPGCGLRAGLDPVHSPGPDALNRTFTYDTFGRLVSATGRETDTAPAPPWLDTVRGQDVTATRPYTETYRYDDAGNLTNLAHGDPTNTAPYSRTYTLADASNQFATLTKSDDPSLPINLIAHYSWDAAGNLLGEADNRRFEWDHANRLATFRDQTNPRTTPTVYAMYRYDSSGERVIKIVRKSAGTDEVTVYLGGFERTLVGNIGGPPPIPYDELHINDHSVPLACLLRGDPHPRDPFQDDRLRYQIGDHLRSVVATVDDGGGVLNREEYLPYGETSFGSYARKRYRYTGKERDNESGLAYHTARYYAPWLGRWANCDPAGHIDLLNLYSYARNNPISRSDIFGRESKPYTERAMAEVSRLSPLIQSEAHGDLAVALAAAAAIADEASGLWFKDTVQDRWLVPHIPNWMWDFKNSEESRPTGRLSRAYFDLKRFSNPRGWDLGTGNIHVESAVSLEQRGLIAPPHAETSASGRAHETAMWLLSDEGTVKTAVAVARDARTAMPGLSKYTWLDQAAAMVNYYKVGPGFAKDANVSIAKGVVPKPWAQGQQFLSNLSQFTDLLYSMTSTKVAPMTKADQPTTPALSGVQLDFMSIINSNWFDLGSPAPGTERAPLSQTH